MPGYELVEDEWEDLSKAVEHTRNHPDHYMSATTEINL